MGKILCIETATRICSVAFGKDGIIVSKRETTGNYSHSEKLTLFIQDVIDEAGITIRELDAVAVSKGPGSFTGLRIGVSTAKGLCYAIDKPLISAGTLQLMAIGMVEMTGVDDQKDSYLYCPMIDALRMEVYTALYDKQNREIMAPVAEIINPDSFAGYFKDHHIIFSGDGAGKCKQHFNGQPKAIFSELQIPSAVHMITIAERAFAARSFENIAYFEPYYLKDFVAGKPNVKGLR